MTIHLNLGKGVTACGIEKSKRWFSQLLVLNKNPKSTTCKRCKKKAPQ